MCARVAAAPSRQVVLVHGAGGGGWEFDVWRRRGGPFGTWAAVARDLEPSKSGLAATTLSDYATQVVGWSTDASTPPRPRALVGASMGGAVALLAAPRVRPRAIVLVNPVCPRPWGVGPPSSYTSDIIRWAGTSFERTARALPDCTPEVQRWACERWRDESGRAMRELQSSAYAESSLRPQCRVLFVVSGADTDVPPEQQLAWAQHWNADTLTYPGVSHVGALIGVGAPEVARDVAAWLDAAM